MPDTNVFSAYAKGMDAGLCGRVDEAKGLLVVSAIALGEMEYGWQKSSLETKRIRRQKEVALRASVAAFDAEAARAYGYVKAHLMHRLPNAQPIGERDMQIAAHALSLGVTMVTGNEGEFWRVPGLNVVTWQTR